MLANPLIFKPIFPTSAGAESAAFASEGYKEDVAPPAGEAVLDLNAKLWVSLSNRCSAYRSDSTPATAAGQEDTHVAAIVTPEREQDTWRIAVNPTKMSSLVRN